MTNIVKQAFFIFLLLVVCSACKKSTEDTPVVVKPVPFKVSILPQTTYQTISGFGGANRMWGTQSLKPAEATKAFGLGDGELGLSIFRVRLSSNKSEWPIIVEAVKEQLDITLEEWGYHLIDLQLNDITFDEEVMRSMAKVVASNNLRSAAENEGQALLITRTKAAEAEGNFIKIKSISLTII